MKSYLITSRQYYTDTPAVFRSILHERLAVHHPDFVLYRDKFDPNYALMAEYAVQTCRAFEGIKAFVHQDYKLAKALGADGVHLTSKQFDLIKKAKNADLEVIVSTHSIEELHMVRELCADYATFSPVFASPGKGEPKGVDALAQAVKEVDLKIFALGGIVTPEDVKKIEPAHPYGFASIRYFYEDHNG